MESGPSERFGEYWKGLLIALSILECSCFAGLPYGWNSLIYILKIDGIFEDLCSKSNYTNSSTDGTCKQQDERLNLIFSVGLASVFVLVVYIGILNTQFGEIKTRIIHQFVFAAGALFLVFSSADFPWFTLPGLILVGIGEYALLITNIRVALLLERGSVVYAFLLNGSFDSSAVMLLIVKILYNYGIGHKASFIGIMVLHVVISGSCTLLHWIVIDRKKNVMTNDMEIKTTGNGMSDIEPNNFNEKEKQVSVQETELITWKSSVCSVNFMMLLMWVSSNVLNFVFFVGSMNTKLEKEFQNPSDVDHYTNVLGYMMTAGILTSFLAGLFQEWQKWLFKDNPSIRRRKLLPLVAPLCITSTLGIILAVLSFFRTASWNLYTSFTVTILYRAFIFGANMNYIIYVFPPKYVTLLFGINQSVFGMFSLLQYALFLWRDLYDDAFKHVSVFLLTIGLVSMLHSIRTWLMALRNKS